MERNGGEKIGKTGKSLAKQTERERERENHITHTYIMNVRN